MEPFQTVLSFILGHQKMLGYGAVSLLTAGGERIFSQVVFECPCNSWNLLYGAVFLWVPALVLFLLGLLLHTRSWKMLTGCCAPGRPSLCCHQGSRTWRCLQVLWLAVAHATVAPVTWISVALLGGHFYACAASGSTIVQKHMCNGKGDKCFKLVLQAPCGGTSEEMGDMLKYLKVQSQVMGWILISCVMTLTLLCTCVSRCRSPVSALHLGFWKTYLEKEQQLFEVKAKEHAAKLAERNLKCFFDSTELEPFGTPSTKAWQGISSLFAFNPQEHYYSTIHKYVSRKNTGGSMKSEEGDTFPVCLGFVDSAETRVL